MSLFSAAEEQENPKSAFVKIFNAALRNGVERWETGLDLTFREQKLASDVRSGEGGLVRQITYKSKDTVDVHRHREFLSNKRPASSRPAAQLATTFDPVSIHLLVVHGELGPNGEKLRINVIKEFPVPDEVMQSGKARFSVANFRPGKPVFLAIGSMPPLELPYMGQHEFFLEPNEVEIFLIHKKPSDTEFRRQLTLFKFEGDRNYTGIIAPAVEITDRPIFRISDSNQEWSDILKSQARD
jgi:hypothetical protein